ncbi:MAG TPA: FAD-dependent oxidoreductase [Streptosporangiaceae bacterium]|nr:FAD-dependent oxidoreductase [Streptosporangiaceae bacterium]
MEKVVIVGGGLAGVRTVEALRRAGFEGELTLVGAEPHRPYDRPPLSKAVLMGDADDTTLDVDLDALRCRPLLGHRATALRLAGAGGAVDTTAGELAFDGLVIATGATPIALPGTESRPSEGATGGAARIHLLRTIDDARALRAVLRPGRRLAIVGAGWIGAEVATAAARAGCRVTVVEAADVPLAAAMGAEVGALTTSWYAEAGVELLLGRKVAAASAGGLALADGGWVDADDVLVCVGVRPETGWLAGSGLALDNGVVVDESLRAAVDGATRPDVVAVGDCAAWWSARYGRRLRIEHWDTALSSPDVAAAGLMGRPASYDPVPYFWSEQFGRTVQYAGWRQGAETMVTRGDPAGRKWALCWLTDDRLDAILAVDKPRDLVQARRIMAAGGHIDPALLADPEIPVRNAVPT